MNWSPDICGPLMLRASGMAANATALVAMRAKRMTLTLQVRPRVFPPGFAAEMLPRGSSDAALLRFQADIDIRYALSRVNVNLSKFDAYETRGPFAASSSGA